MDLELQDVHVLVTGASGGIGLETTRLFLKQGAKVTAHYNTNATSLNALTAEFGPGRVATAQANLSIKEDVVRMFVGAATAFGPVQVAIINHGVWPTADEPVATMSLDRWRATFDSNTTSSFLVAREFLRQLATASDAAKAKASILFLGSTAGKYGEADHADYAASKSALMYGLTLSLKNEIVKIAPRGRVNSVAPGWVNTPMAAESLKDPVTVYRALATTALKKIAEPWDVATQVVVLSSPKLSGHVTGQALMVEGGMEGVLLNQNTEQGLVAY
ncbi:NAD(P)-binding protein [Mycena latifolia]|nr:NAD(P)-binding protein [Mycena latifolia]